MNPDPRDYSIGTRDHGGPDTEPIKAVGTRERQRAAIALGVLAIVALVVVGIMVALLGRGTSSTSVQQPIGGPTGPAVTVTGGQSPTQHKNGGGHTSRPARPTRSSGPQQPPSRPRGAAVSCPTSAPCSLPDDVGHAVRALNAYRTAHGKPAVRGSVTQAARTCAVSNGNDCPSSFFWEPVGRSGQQVIQKIGDSGDGVSWLLSDQMTAVQVGWAYIPASHSFECALVSVTG